MFSIQALQYKPTKHLIQLTFHHFRHWINKYKNKLISTGQNFMLVQIKH